MRHLGIKRRGEDYVYERLSREESEQRIKELYAETNVQAVVEEVWECCALQGVATYERSYGSDWHRNYRDHPVSA